MRAKAIAEVGLVQPRPGEPDYVMAYQRQVVVADPIALMSAPGAVVFVPIEFDDELLLRPERVNLVARDVAVHGRQGQALAVHESEEAPLHFRPDEWGLTVSGHRCSEPRDTPAAGTAGDQPIHLAQVEQLESLRLLDCALETARRRGRQIEQSARQARDRYRVDNSPIVACQGGSAQPHPGPRRTVAGANHLRNGVRHALDTPERRGTSMTEDGTGSTTENRRHPTSPRRKARMPDCIDAAMDHVQPPAAHPVIDGVLAVPESPQLAPCDHTVLPRGDFRDPPWPS